MSQTEVSAREFSAAPYEADGEPLGLADVPSGPVPMNGADEGRLRTMVDVHFDFIWRSLRRLGVPPNDVDDAAQQVFWIAAKNLQRIETRSERSYLFGTALRVASDARRLRARGREVNGDESLDWAAHPAPGPDELLDQKRAREILDELLDGMPMDLRTMLILVEGEGLTGTEVARLLEIPEGTVSSRLRRAREALAQGVERLRKRSARPGGSVR